MYVFEWKEGGPIYCALCEGKVVAEYQQPIERDASELADQVSVVDVLKEES